jgi:hypothetical protein
VDCLPFVNNALQKLMRFARNVIIRRGLLAMNDSAVLAGEQHMRVKRCRHGLMLYNSSDIYIGRSLDLYGEYSHGEADVFEHLLRPGMVAIDVGAKSVAIHC